MRIPTFTFCSQKMHSQEHFNVDEILRTLQNDLTSQSQQRERTVHYPISLQRNETKPSSIDTSRNYICKFHLTRLKEKSLTLHFQQNNLGHHALKIGSPSAQMPEVPTCLYEGQPHTDVDTCSGLLCTAFQGFSQCISGLQFNSQGYLTDTLASPSRDECNYKIPNKN